MSAFSADWLALREPADAEARSARLMRALASRLPPDRELGVVDLGAGTGSNVRVLAEPLPARQRWVLVDHDADLLSSMPEQMTAWGAARGYRVTADAGDLLIRGTRLDCRLTTRRMELHVGIDDEGLYENCDLVTASALLDLVSEGWLRRLASHCANRGACVLFALTYDGRIVCSPSEAEDELIRELVNRHQRTDKGFGVALGPDAATAARACFAHAGYEVHLDASDWALTPQTTELQRQLIDGWAEAAIAIAPDQTATIDRWRTRRRAHVDARRSQLLVGHTDLVAWPAR